MSSPACILSLIVTAVVRGELGDVWGWSDDPEPMPQKPVQEAPTALPNVENGNSVPQANISADGDQVNAEVTEGDEDEGAGEQEDGKDEIKPKKRKNRGRKKV